ncbi:MAG: ABC transporter permease [Chloroflexi bacterium]|nr:ABC transporter permease [Chloroflexota bacterium]
MNNEAEMQPTSIHKQFTNTLLGRFLQNGNMVVGTLLVAALLFLAVFANWLSPYSPVEQHPADRLQSPSTRYIMGTDEFGRDLFSRIIHGATNSLRISIVSVTISSLIGTLLGVIAAYKEGVTDFVVMRFMDLLFAFPTIILAMAIAAALGPGFMNTVMAISIVYIPTFARVARGSVLYIKQLEYINAATIIGASHWRKIWRHIIPNAITPSIVQISMAFSWAILTETSLSYLGLGTQPPLPSWGSMISESRRMMELAPWLAIFPGAAIMVTVLSFNLMGDGLRDLLDPRTQTLTKK